MASSLSQCRLLQGCLLPRSLCLLQVAVSSCSVPHSFCFLVVSTSSVSTSSQNSSPLMPLLCHVASLSITCSCHFSSPVVSLLPTDASERKNLVGLLYSYLGRSSPTGLPRCLIDSWPAYGLAVLDQVPSMVLSPVGGLIRPGASSCLGLW